LDAAVQAREQLNTYLVFESADVVTQGRRRYVEFSCGTVETQVSTHGLERPKPGEQAGRELHDETIAEPYSAIRSRLSCRLLVLAEDSFRLNGDKDEGEFSDFGGDNARGVRDSQT
jgi:hypothetical protein